MLHVVVLLFCVSVGSIQVLPYRSDCTFLGVLARLAISLHPTGSNAFSLAISIQVNYLPMKTYTFIYVLICYHLHVKVSRINLFNRLVYFYVYSYRSDSRHDFKRSSISYQNSGINDPRYWFFEQKKTTQFNGW